jgi:hypothetical protein
MARLNELNLLCHFAHCGVDMIPDNTCHYGMNIFFADNGLLGQHPTPLKVTRWASLISPL